MAKIRDELEKKNVSPYAQSGRAVNLLLVLKTCDLLQYSFEHLFFDAFQDVTDDPMRLSTISANY